MSAHYSSCDHIHTFVVCSTLDHNPYCVISPHAECKNSVCGFYTCNPTCSPYGAVSLQTGQLVRYLRACVLTSLWTSTSSLALPLIHCTSTSVISFARPRVHTEVQATLLSVAILSICLSPLLHIPHVNVGIILNIRSVGLPIRKHLTAVMKDLCDV